jgi:ADP-ribosylglycohydrolase
LPDASTPLFSLLNGEGAGAMLGAAAGDVAGGRSPLGYSAFTQQATIVAYHLMRNDNIDRPALSDDLLELGPDATNPSVYRASSDQFDGWLEAVIKGEAAATAEPSAEPAARCFPVGVWFRRDPGRLVPAAIAVARLTHIDAATVVAATALAGATAACSFAQNGRDLIHGCAEVAERAIAELMTEDYLYSRIDDAREFISRLQQSAEMVGFPADDLVRRLGGEGGPAATDWPIVAMVLASVVEGEPYRQIETAALIGGSLLATMVGAMIGARIGIRSWPWVVPNDTWFAEIGRRLVRGDRETRDLPVPYRVEEHLTFARERDPL